MSLLPQRKKSAEEIAKLRESLGIVGSPADGEESKPEVPVMESAIRASEGAIPEALPRAMEVTPVAPQTPSPLSGLSEVEQVRSLTRLERTPDLSVEVHTSQSAERLTEPSALSQRQPKRQKAVRSLRKSEQGPLAKVHLPPPDSKLPIHRHNDREVQEIRRQEALAMQSSGSHLISNIAHPIMIIPGYVLALAGAVCFYFYELQIEITAGCLVAAMLIAGFIFFKKPLSKHHSAFIFVICLFVAVFGALYYFPQLRYGT